MGGRFELGFLSGFASSLGASYSNKVSNKMGVMVGIAAAVGGTAEVLGGGKFANGAVTGAFVALFNHKNHNLQSKSVGRLLNEKQKNKLKDIINKSAFYERVSNASYDPEDDVNGRDPLDTRYKC